MKFNDLYQLMTETFDNTSEVIEEGSGHGDEKAVKNLIKIGIDKGLIKPFPKDTTDGWMLQSTVDGSQHLAHKGERGLHPLRRYLQGLERVSKVSR